MKKRIISLFMLLVLMFSLTACGGSKAEVGRDINIASLKGPTSMGLAKLYDDQDNEKTKNNYNYNIVNTPDEIVAGLSKGDFDIAAVPANLAAVLYNKSEGNLLQVSNINTLGVLYLASADDSIKDIKDLKGKTIILSGKGATPEYAIRYLLEKNGLDPNRDVVLSYKSEHTEVLQELINDNKSVAILPEPFLTIASKKANITNTISLNDMWQEINPGENLITGVLVVRKEFLKDKNNKMAFDAFLDEYKNSVNFTNDNIEEAAKLIGKYDIVKEEVALEAIPNCNIVYIDSDEMKDQLESYLTTLYVEDPNSIGGAMPDDEFYYKK